MRPTLDCEYGEDELSAVWMNSSTNSVISLRIKIINL
jgi:hypothetical protein